MFTKGNTMNSNKKLKIFVSLLTIILFTSLLFSRKESEQEISYIGFGDQTTISGPMHCIQVDEKLYMVDAGSFYGDDGNNYPLPEELDIGSLEAVFITHTHVDHIGRPPLLLEEGYLGPIYMTEIT